MGWDFHKDFLFYSNIAKDLKHSLPAGLGLSETQITSHGFDSTKEGITEAEAYEGKSPCIFKDGWVEDASIINAAFIKKHKNWVL